MKISQQRHCKSTQFQAPTIQDLQLVCLQPTSKYDMVHVNECNVWTKIENKFTLTGTFGYVTNSFGYVTSSFCQVTPFIRSCYPYIRLCDPFICHVCT